MADRRSNPLVTKELHQLRKIDTKRRGHRPAPWVERAACRGMDTDAWLDDRPDLPTAAARAVCAACPVRAACLAHALACDEPWGLWGGLTTRERLAHRLGLLVRASGQDEQKAS